MGYRYWNGTEWVRCSDAEAAKRRERGQRVIERPDAVAPIPAPSTIPAAAPPRPAASWAPGDLSLDDLDADQLAELEKLTAPGATRGS